MFVEERNCAETGVVGLLIDSVDAVLDIADRFDRRTASPRVPCQFGLFVTGIGRAGEHFIVILNINRVLDIQMLSRFGA